MRTSKNVAVPKEAMLWRQRGEGGVECYLCNHHCRITEGQFGICGMRENRMGKLYTYAYGDLIAAHVDPIEKKPLYHFMPGTSSFSIATMGCNFQCAFCQNWQISQISQRDGGSVEGYRMRPDEVVEAAIGHQCRSISYTYTEPTIFFEYAYEISRLASQAGLANVFVTNGYMTTEALEIIAPYLDAANIDLKSFRDEFYRKTCRGHLEPVLESIRFMKKLGVWIEITTLLVPGTNDSEEELTNIARFIAEVDQDIPWHVSRFHPDYRMQNIDATPLEIMKTAYSIGKKAGLHYIYLGNMVGESVETLCPGCRNVVIRRRGFWLERNDLSYAQCPHCGSRIAGVFDKRPAHHVSPGDRCQTAAPRQ